MLIASPTAGLADAGLPNASRAQVTSGSIEGIRSELPTRRPAMRPDLASQSRLAWRSIQRVPHSPCRPSPSLGQRAGKAHRPHRSTASPTRRRKRMPPRTRQTVKQGSGTGWAQSLQDCRWPKTRSRARATLECRTEIYADSSPSLRLRCSGPSNGRHVRRRPNRSNQRRTAISFYYVACCTTLGGSPARLPGLSVHAMLAGGRHHNNCSTSSSTILSLMVST